MVRFVNGEVILYDYDPSLPAAVIAVIIFAILSAAHGWRMIKHRTWFCIPFVIGGLCKSESRFRILIQILIYASSSWSCWLCRSRFKSLGFFCSHALHYSICPYSDCSGFVRCYDIYDFGESNESYSWRKIFHRSSTLAYQALRHWWHPVVLHSRRWWRNSDQRQHQRYQDGSRYYSGWLVSSDYNVWLVYHNFNHIPPSIEKISHSAILSSRYPMGENDLGSIFCQYYHHGQEHISCYRIHARSGWIVADKWMAYICVWRVVDGFNHDNLLLVVPNYCTTKGWLQFTASWIAVFPWRWSSTNNKKQ